MRELWHSACWFSAIINNNNLSIINGFLLKLSFSCTSPGCTSNMWFALSWELHHWTVMFSHILSFILGELCWWAGTTAACTHTCTDNKMCSGMLWKCHVCGLQCVCVSVCVGFCTQALQHPSGRTVFYKHLVYEVCTLYCNSLFLTSMVYLSSIKLINDHNSQYFLSLLVFLFSVLPFLSAR